MNDLYNRYALALLDIAKEENRVEEYRQEVVSFLAVLKENPELSKILDSYNITNEEKLSLIDGKLGKFYSENIINYIKVILKNNRGYYLYSIFKETLMRFDDYLSIEQGTIYSTIPLSQKDILRVTEAIERNTGKKIILKNVIDSSIIGGIKVVLKNDIYDASILSRVDALKESLLKKGN
jgi:F-type H+-transporting ATPase subunit delta